ncbi:delta-aminolevulinic acid dehydratase [Haliea sp.]|uniref:delta-aminolevulinic acid dehydratase n=1 Tax=Haliea sp. TaxID=1932666 RepID=UPI003526ECBD
MRRYAVLASITLSLLATLTFADPGKADDETAENSTPEASCLCLWEGSFADVQDRADLVAAVTVTGGKGNSVDLAVDSILRGREYNQSIRLWLQARDYCRPDATEFSANSRWVMALYRITEQVPGGFDPMTPNISYGRLGDYYLSSCGGYWLQRHDDRVTGNLVDAPRWEREPKMTPVLLDLLAAYVRGDISREALRQASREDPALRELMLDTSEFLREAQ